MDRTHDTHGTHDTETDGRMVYAGRFGDDKLTDDDRDTLQTAFAALVRSGRPLFGPVPEEGAGALIDPADPGLNTRVSAILDGRPSLFIDEHGPMGRIASRDDGPRLPRRAAAELTTLDDAGDAHGQTVCDELDRCDPALDIADVDELLIAEEGEA